MNAKQTVPLLTMLPTIAAAAPPLIIGGAIFVGTLYLLEWLFSNDDKEKKPEIKPPDTETEFRRKEAESAQKIPAFRTIPAEIPAKPAIVSVSSAPKPFIPPVSVAPVPKIPPTQAPPPPIKKKFVTREDLAAVFQRGARALTRTTAVAALKKLGFGKTAAYDALSPDGRFSVWLRFAPDGIITWKG